MMDRPKFRRKHKSASGKIATDDAFAPVPPLESRAERLARRHAEEVEADASAEDARREAEDEAMSRAEEARLKGEAEKMARAEEAHRQAEAVARAEAARGEAEAEEARRKAKAEEKACAEEARREAEAEEKARAEEVRREAEAQEKARLEETRRRADAEQKARAEEARRRAEAEEKARAVEARRRAEAVEKARAEEARRKAEAADKARAEEARQRAETEAKARAEDPQNQAEADKDPRGSKARDTADKDARGDAPRDMADAEAQRRRDLAARREQAEARARKARADLDRLEAEARRAAEEEAAALGQPRPQPKSPPLTLNDPVRPEPAVQPPADAPVSTARTPRTVQTGPNRAWAALGEVTVDERHLHRNRIITARRDDPAHTAFDVLRTRLLQALSEHGWKRVAITSPGQGCGKTFTAANLAISLSRQENCRTVLMDCDLRRPTLHQVMGIDRPGSVGDMLRGRISPEEHLKRMGPNPVQAGRNIAFGFNDVVEPYASELLQDPRTAETLNRIETDLGADVMLFDLPPALFYDDVIAFRPLFDGVLLVVGGGLTTEKEIKEVERRLGEGTPLLGMVLNKAEGTEMDRYTY